MTQTEALRLALEALESTGENNGYHGVTQYFDETMVDQAITAIKAALEAKDEPVGWAEHGVINWLADKQFNHTSFLYATPPQRTWVGLTDEDRFELAKAQHGWEGLLIAAEAKLKQKNFKE